MGRQLDLMVLEVFSNLNDSMILCFSPVQLHPKPARGVDAEKGFPAAAAGEQGAVGGSAPAAAGAAAAGERGAQAAVAGRAAEADRGAEGAEAKAGGGNWPKPSNGLAKAVSGQNSGISGSRSQVTVLSLV